MYIINNVTPEECNCIQLRQYFKTFKIQTIWNSEHRNKRKFEDNEGEEKNCEIVSHHQKKPWKQT